MLVSCSYCGRIHKRGIACSNKPPRKKEETYISRFRNTNAWKKKRQAIKARDLLMCQLCLLNNRYQFNDLEVHHIYSIANKWNKRLDSLNLITLCKPCHKRAEYGEVEKKLLLEIAGKNEAKASQGQEKKQG